MTEKPEAEQKFRGSWSGYERDCEFHNPDGKSTRFFNTAYLFGLDFDDDGRAVCPVDFDGDGDLDLVCLSLQGLRVMENLLPQKHFARFRLTATNSNPLALNAVVKVTAGGVTHQDYVKITDGFMTQVPRELHFGLGNAEKIDQVIVQWPGAAPQRFLGVPVDKLIELTEGREEFSAIEIPYWPGDSRPKSLPPFSFDTVVTKVGGGEGPLAAKGRPAVVNFWSPSCAPCKEELPQLVALAKARGETVQFAGVSAETKDLDSVKATLASFAVPYPQFLANDAFVKGFFGGDAGAILPSTFVFDAGGRLRRVFHRAITTEELSALLDSLKEESASAADIEARGAALMGHGDFETAAEWLRKSIQADPNRASAHNHLGAACSGMAERIEAGSGPAASQEEEARRRREAIPKWDESIAHLKRAVELEPDYAEAQYNLGVAYQRTGRHEAAIGPLQASIKAGGDSYDAWYTLGMAAGGAKQNALAGEAFDRALAIAPKKTEAWIGKALWMRQIGRPDEAKKCLQKALEIEPGNGEARSMLEGMNGK
ncbi:MAG: tetratricopeptide repeat protein [Planctomycetes bacterium]|nr:tetratricopeptide repeat protein [Planctomycetota bacterium]